MHIQPHLMHRNMKIFVFIIQVMILHGVNGEFLAEDIQTNVVSIESCLTEQYLHNNNCESCSKCSDKEYTRFKCNATRNTVCECTPGHYRDYIDGQCKECAKCPAGWGAFPACTSTNNTICVACPNGSYSDMNSSTKSCQSCKLCVQEDEVLIRRCTSQQDTWCHKGARNTQSNEAVIKSKICEDGLCETQNENAYLYTAPLYCAVLGAIILGLLIYVILRCKVNKNRAAQLAANGSAYQKQPLNYHLVTQQHLFGQHGTAPVVYLQDCGKTVVVTASTKYKDVASAVRRMVARSLAQDGSWLQLAHNLGFTPSEISQIQQKAESNYRGTSAASILLSEWSKRDFSSIGVITHALASINRLDLVTLIHNSNSMKGSEIV